MLRALTSFRFAVAVCLLLPLMAHAAGLGRLTVQSSLGQPLRAEIALVSVQPGEESGLVARIAPPDAFQAAGIEYTSTMVNLRVAVERRDGRPVLRLTSAQPVNEPFLELLIELQWATGRLVRQYTFLLDPAEYKPPRAAPAPAPAPAPAAKPAPAAPKAAKPAAVTPPKARTYEVQKGDTLSKVARDTKPADVTVNQMLAALFQANKDAFIRDNMYLMRAGHILKVPEGAAAGAISHAEATRLVRSHAVDFDDYRRGLAASVATAPAKPAPPAEREMPGRIAPKPAEPAPKQPKDQIKLSRADPGKPTAPATQAAKDDDKVALGRALKESQSRVADLEKQIADLKKLIELKNQQLALLEQKAAGKPTAAAPPPAKPAAEAPKPAAAPAQPAAAPPPAKPTPEAPKAAAVTPPPKPAAPPAPKAPAAAAKPKPAPPPPPPEVSLVDEFLDNPVALGGLGGVLVLLIGYGVWAWRRKKSSQAREGGFASLAAAPAAPATEGIQPAVPAAVAAAAAAATVASEPAAGEDVDPIAEAEIYLAYGRDAQAEAILKDALESDPDRLNVHSKLLDIYAQRKDKSAFEQTALKVKAITGGTGPDWDKATSLGRAVDPENGLYGTGPAAGGGDSPAPSSASASPSLDFDIGGSTSPGVGTEPAAPAAVDFDIDKLTGGGEPSGTFQPGDTVVMSAKDVATEAPSAPSLDLDIGATTQAPAKPSTPKPEAPPEPAALDFDLDFDLGESKPAQPAAPAASVDPKWQEVATKLDLAKAYQEMGDKNGARELLDEVLKEGDAAQQEEAKRVLAKLG